MNLSLKISLQGDIRLLNRRVIGKAFYKSIPVLAGYVVLGIGFGMLMRAAGDSQKEGGR